MTSATTTAILKLIGVLTIFVGLILFTTVLVQIVAASTLWASNASVQMSGPLAKLGLFGFLSTGAVSLWGVVLYRASPVLGNMIGNQAD